MIEVEAVKTVSEEEQLIQRCDVLFSDTKLAELYSLLLPYKVSTYTWKFYLMFHLISQGNDIVNVMVRYDVRV